jgi:hypothetical protein
MKICSSILDLYAYIVDDDIIGVIDVIRGVEDHG